MKKMNIKIRQYHPSDTGSIVNVWEKANALAHPFLKEEYVKKVKNDISELYLPNADTWIADDGESVVGFLSLIGNEVGGLFVLPNQHKKGIGELLMNKARALHGDLEVEVFKKNTIGRNFYKKYGFKLLEEKIHEPTTEEVLRLRYKDLSSD